MTRKLSSHGMLLPSCLMLVLVGSAARAGEPQTRTNPDAQVLADFKVRLDEYVKLRSTLQKDSRPPREKSDPATIRMAQEGLAKSIRAARTGAKPGDIFTPEARTLFQRLMHPELAGPVGTETRETMKEDAPKGVKLTINAPYPEGAPLPTVPPNLLAALPPLPDDLEYRFIDRTLILRDVRANLIVDYVQNILK